MTNANWLTYNEGPDHNDPALLLCLFGVSRTLFSSIQILPVSTVHILRCHKA